HKEHIFGNQAYSVGGHSWFLPGGVTSSFWNGGRDAASRFGGASRGPGGGRLKMLSSNGYHSAFLTALLPEGKWRQAMKAKAVFLSLVLLAGATSAAAKDPKLDGAYRYVSTTFPGRKQTDAEMKGLLVVHGRYLSFVRAGVDRKTWDQQEPA